MDNLRYLLGISRTDEMPNAHVKKGMVNRVKIIFSGGLAILKYLRK